MENLGQVGEHVVLEATWLGTFEPYSEMKVSSFITDMMRENGQNELIESYNMSPFMLQVLSKERTFCEKIMSLVRFSKTDTPIADLRNKIRHIYDIHQMLKDEDITLFFNSPDFDKMLNKVGSDDLVSFKNNNDWVYEHPVNAMIFDNPKEIWGQISSEYHTNFKDLVTGDFPLEKQLIDTLNIVAERLKEVDWKIS